MGIFSRLFGLNKEQEEKKILPWIPLQREEQLDAIIEQSKDKLQIIFKHSTRCGISKSVINRFIDEYDLSKKNIDLYYLDLLNFRDISNKVGDIFNVIHQSPQILVIKDGIVLHHASHHEIHFERINKYVF